MKNQRSIGAWIVSVVRTPVLLLMNALNGVFRRSGPDPGVYRHEDFPWSRGLEAAYPAIRAECERILPKFDQLPDIGSATKGSGKLINLTEWKGYFLVAFEVPLEKTVARCPETYAALQQIPNLQNAFFSILGPNACLPRHKGYFAGFLRCHLGVVIPEPPGAAWIEVNDTRYGWKDGEAFIFDDTHPHEVQNNTDAKRVVLIVDFLRPCPWPLRIVQRGIVTAIRHSPLIAWIRRQAEAAA